MTTSATDSGSATGAAVLAGASSGVDQLIDATQAHHARLEQLQAADQYTEDYRRQAMNQERATFGEHLRTSREAITTALETAESAATRHLAAPADEATETRKARAAMRVSRVIDSGTSALDAAQLFVEQGDVDALRALRDEVPSWLAATLPRSEQSMRKGHIDRTLLELDRMMAPLLDGPAADAVQVRLTAAAQRDRLDAITEHAFHPSAHTLMSLGYANSGSS